MGWPAAARCPSSAASASEGGSLGESRLAAATPTPRANGRDRGGELPAPALQLLDDPERGTVAEGLTQEGVQCVEQLADLLGRVEERRQVGTGGPSIAPAGWADCPPPPHPPSRRQPPLH